MSQLNSVTVQGVLASYAAGRLTPASFLAAQLEAARSDTTNSWLSLISDEQLAAYVDGLEGKSPDELPLFGVPFAIKDNIDLADLPTTAGCAEYSYQPEESAFVVAQLIHAGAVPLGKTNLDQFATGLVGTRSPWGAVHNSFDPNYVSGGSSSGSAVAVATGQVCFSLGTDTAGSGRVPAAFNNIIGMKASKGLLSCSGVVPACKSLDCVTLFAHTTADINLLLDIAGQYDVTDCYARADGGSEIYQTGQALSGKSIGVPKAAQLEFFGNQQTQALFQAALNQLSELGAELVEVDFEPFLNAAKLLYEGPWVAERYAAIQSFFEADSSRCLPVIETIIGGAQGKTAVDAFKATYQLQAYKVRCDEILAGVDAIVTPTAGSIYTIGAVNADPITLNSNLGYYTNFMNLLDYAAIAVPAGFQQTGLPFGITLFGQVWQDRKLLSMGGQLQQAFGLPLGATILPLPIHTEAEQSAAVEEMVELVVCGAHLAGLPLNHQLLDRDAVLLEETTTSANYRFYALAGGPPFRPGLIRTEQHGAAIAVEVWQMPVKHLGSFLQGIPQPLGLGKVELADGRWCTSFICEGYAIETATDITHFGGWRQYMQS
ncbi:allophanate hydrolase [Neiella marina]|uniref:Allophanate hydrolase n=1 Tax=Neiella holothuriorum TaxID=2870530 RepID=A0ABS7EFC8_9GAMM|nr:allophanate hydrolase [Neiella holothuriorum]MBW8191061.1 allophanate hydrolase [Neiella holothuriorum]